MRHPVFTPDICYLRCCHKNFEFTRLQFLPIFAPKPELPSEYLANRRNYKRAILSDKYISLQVVPLSLRGTTRILPCDHNKRSGKHRSLRTLMSITPHCAIKLQSVLMT